jgi:tetratricopeptide (TPR) repeat protein
LAIELVAARMNIWSPQTLLARLHRRLTLLTDGPRDLPVHQQTLRGTIDWSYDLLDAGQQALFARLSVFGGGCCLTTAEEVANADADLPTTILDGLTALADQSLLRQEDRPNGERYFVYFETIREYARERLIERGEEQAIRARFATYYLNLTETASVRLVGGEQETWLDRLDAEHDNIRAALEHFIHRGQAEAAWRMAAALWKFWHIRSHQITGRRWLAQVFALDAPPLGPARAQALYGAGWLALDHGDNASARAFFDESLARFRALGDARGVAEALHGVGMMVQAAGDDAQAVELFEESLALFRELADDEGIAWSLDHVGAGLLSLDEHRHADELFTESLAIFRRLRHTWGSAIALHHLGLSALAGGDFATAAKRVDEALALFRELENGWGVAASMAQLGWLAVARDDYRRADASFHASLTMSQTAEDTDTIAGSFVGLASALLAREQVDAAAQLLGAYEALTGANKIRMNPFARQLYLRDRAVLRDRSARASVAQAWARGHAMSLHDAMAFALTLAADTAD